MLEAMFGRNINNTANILIQLSQVKEGKEEVMMGSGAHANQWSPAEE